MIKRFLLVVLTATSMGVSAADEEIFQRSISVYGAGGNNVYEYVYNDGTDPNDVVAGLDTKKHFLLGAGFYARPGIYGREDEGLSFFRYNMFMQYEYTSGNMTSQKGTGSGKVNGFDLGWAFHFLLKIPNEKFKFFIGPTLFANVSTLNMSGGDQEAVFGSTLSYGDRTNLSAMIGIDAGFMIRLNKELDMEIGYKYANEVWSLSQSDPYILNSHGVSNQIFLAFTFY